MDTPWHHSAGEKKNRLKSNCFVLRCNDHSWLFSPLIMIKVSRGLRRDIVWETDGLLFYCDMTGWMNNKNGGRGRIFVRGSWLEEKECAVIDFSGRGRGRKVDSGGVCNQRDKAKRTSAVKRQVLCKKKKQHTSPSLCHLEYASSWYRIPYLDHSCQHKTDGLNLISTAVLPCLGSSSETLLLVIPYILCVKV